MKITYSSLRIPLMGALVALSLSAFTAQAQEGRTSDLEPGRSSGTSSREYGREGGEATHLEHSNTIVPTSKSEPAKDSMATIVKQPIVAPNTNSSNSGQNSKPTRPAEGRNQKEEDPSVLSFNFLYYIIQRYKLSDIVD